MLPSACGSYDELWEDYSVGWINLREGRIAKAMEVVVGPLYLI